MSYTPEQLEQLQRNTSQSEQMQQQADRDAMEILRQTSPASAPAQPATNAPDIPLEQLPLPDEQAVDRAIQQAMESARQSGFNLPESLFDVMENYKNLPTEPPSAYLPAPDVPVIPTGQRGDIYR